MSIYNVVKPGLANVGSYQVSGIPFASSSLIAPANGGAPLQIDFPYVTKFVVVKNTNTSGSLRVGFSENGINGTNYFLLAGGESFAGDIKISRLYLVSDDGSTTTASVVAGLTGIHCNELQSNWSGSIGVG